MADVAATTARLTLRDWDEEDLDEFVRVTNTPAVMRWLGGVWPREHHDAALGRIAAYQRDFGHTLWIVEDRSSGELLGFCGLKRVNAPGAGALTGTAEVGWRLRESAWGQGFAKEAAIAMIVIAFCRLRF
jgi:RimJ/RimL family protein N-acetyltransferase